MKRIRYTKVTETEFLSVRTIPTREGEVVVRYHSDMLLASIAKANNPEAIITQVKADNLHDLKKGIKASLANLGVTFDSETRTKKADRV